MSTFDRRPGGPPRPKEDADDSEREDEDADDSEREAEDAKWDDKGGIFIIPKPDETKSEYNARSAQAKEQRRQDGKKLKQIVSKIADDLEAAGLVSKTPGDEDKERLRSITIPTFLKRMIDSFGGLKMLEASDLETTFDSDVGKVIITDKKSGKIFTFPFESPAHRAQKQQEFLDAIKKAEDLDDQEGTEPGTQGSRSEQTGFDKPRTFGGTIVSKPENAGYYEHSDVDVPIGGGEKNYPGDPGVRVDFTEPDIKLTPKVARSVEKTAIVRERTKPRRESILPVTTKTEEGATVPKTSLLDRLKNLFKKPGQ